jgi:hypothetical protein
MPEIEYAFLADAAQVQPGQKFHVIGGGVSRITGPALPFVHPHLSLVVGLRVTPNERNREHDLGFALVAPDGTQVANAAGKVVAGGPPQQEDVVLTIAIDLWNLELRQLGDHTVRISIDGRERKRLAVTVAQIANQVPEQKYLA